MPQYERLIFAISLVIILFLMSASTSAALSVKGVLQTQLAQSNNEESSYLEGGTRLFRYDRDNAIQLSQALVDIKGELYSNLSFHSVFNYSHTPEPKLGVSQLSLRYKPLWSHRYRWQFRAGMFYPEISFENPDIGWLSPYSYTNSAINNWIGEEVRTMGGEFKVTRPGRANGRSPHTFALTGAMYKGNDPVGTLLAFRGWALHDKQTLLNELIPMAQQNSFRPGQLLELQAPFVEPFREVDGRWGYYTGLHWDYKKRSRLRYYYYNNRADDSALGRNGQYAWNTIFQSLSWQYQLNQRWRFIAQGLDGITSMGVGAVVVDIRSWFAMLHYRSEHHQWTIRYDDFKTVNRDQFLSEDNNNSNGWGLTTTYRHNLNKHWQLGLEVVYLDSDQENRKQFSLEQSLQQTQLLGVIQYRF